MGWIVSIFWGNVIAALILLVAAAWQFLRPLPASEEAVFQIGDITVDSLQYYNGYDYMKPILVAVK